MIFHDRKFTICGVEISRNHAIRLARMIHKILIKEPIRYQDREAIDEMRFIGWAIKGDNNKE